jgi:hypothetical protein
VAAPPLPVVVAPPEPVGLPLSTNVVVVPPGAHDSTLAEAARRHSDEIGSNFSIVQPLVRRDWSFTLEQDGAR